MALLVVWILGVFCGSAVAGDAEEAQIAFELGTRAYERRDYSNALAKFLSSNRLAPNPAVAFNIARCYAKLGRYAEAYRWFTDARAGLSDADVLSAVDAELAAIAPRVVVLDVSSEPSGAQVYIDRRELGVVGVSPFRMAVAPREEGYRLLFDKDGYASVEVPVRGERGQTIPIATSLQRIVGTLEVRAEPGVEARLGSPTGPLLCVSPCTADLAPGNRVLYFRREGYRDEVRQLEILAEQQMAVSVTLAPATGSLTVSTTTPGALVEVDGVPMGVTPLALTTVPVGLRTVRVHQTGYEPIVRSVRVEDGARTTLQGLELEPSDAVTAASRRAEPIQFAPGSVTVLPNEELSAFRYPTLYEALRGTRGLALSSDTLYGTVNVRGIGQPGDFNRRLLVLHEGTALNDRVLSQAPVGYDLRGDLLDVQRIEVLRGPGSIQYGSGAMAGVVNVVTEANAAPNGTHVALGSYEDAVLRGSARTHYSVSDAVGFRASVAAATSRGRDIALTTPEGESLLISGADAFDSASTTGAAWLGSVRLSWLHSWRSQGAPAGPWLTEPNAPANRWTDQRTIAQMAYEPTLSERTTLTVRGTANRFDHEAVLARPDATSVERYTSVSVAGEVRLGTELGQHLRLVSGTVGEIVPIASLTGAPRAEPTERYLDASRPHQLAAAYLLFDYVPLPTVHVTAGGRLDYWSSTGALSPSPRLSAVFVPDEGDYIKVIAGRSFRAPSIFELAYHSDRQPVPQDLRPETIRSAEVEYTHAFDANLTLLVAAWLSRAERLIEANASTGGTGATLPALTLANADQILRSAGADIELARRYRSGWSFSLWASYVSTYELVPGTADEPLPNVPPLQGAAKLIVPLGSPLTRLAFRANVEAARQRAEDRAGSVIADLVLSGAASIASFDYAIGVYNLFDQQPSLPAGGGFPAAAIPQPGRSLAAHLSFGF